MTRENENKDTKELIKGFALAAVLLAAVYFILHPGAFSAAFGLAS